MKYYAGIGSRKTPPEICTLMTRMAAWLREQGYWLRSGHAVGADWAFEQGARERSDIYLPWPQFDTKPYQDDPGRPLLGTAIVDEARWLRNHAAVAELGIFSSTNRANQLLHGRNYAQILGHADVALPSGLVICYTDPEQLATRGGTAMAVRLAEYYDIPVYNLWHPEVRERLEVKSRG